LENLGIVISMDNQLPQSVGESLVSPVVLSPEQEDLCQRLDDFHARNGLKTKPSNMFRGAVFVSQTFLRNNQDWIAQAANSLRDILYPFNGNNTPNKEEALRQYGSAKAEQPGFANEVGRVLGSLTELAHHGNGRGSSVDFSTFSPTDFENLISEFERVMGDVLLRQIDVHHEVDSILALSPEDI
jgi:hypothetical protein